MWLSTYFAPCSGISIVNFEQVNADWDRAFSTEIINSFQQYFSKKKFHKRYASENTKTNDLNMIKLHQEPSFQVYYQYFRLTVFPYHPFMTLKGENWKPKGWKYPEHPKKRTLLLLSLIPGPSSKRFVT